MPSALDRVDIREAGSQYLMSSTDESALREVMDGLLSEGVEVSEAGRLGKIWLASFQHPDLKRCVVTRLGPQITITGPSTRAVTMAADQFIELGARVAEGPLYNGSEWLHVLVQDRISL